MGGDRLVALELELKEKHGVTVMSDSWSLGHLGYLYPGTTPVMTKLYHNRSCPWV